MRLMLESSNDAIKNGVDTGADRGDSGDDDDGDQAGEERVLDCGCAVFGSCERLEGFDEGFHGVEFPLFLSQAHRGLANVKCLRPLK